MDTGPDWIVAAGVVGVLVLVVGAACVYLVLRGTGKLAAESADAARSVIRAPADAAVDLARGLSGALASAFGASPEVRVANEVVHAAPREVLQLVVLEVPIRERKLWSHTRWHSEKRIEVTGEYTAKIGFDLAELRVDVRRDPLKVSVTLPPARLIALHAESVRFDRDESGLWNRLRAEDRNRALEDLRQDVVVRVEASDELERARAHLLSVFERQASSRGVTLEVRDAAPISRGLPRRT